MKSYSAFWLKMYDVTDELLTLSGLVFYITLRKNIKRIKESVNCEVILGLEEESKHHLGHSI